MELGELVTCVSDPASLTADRAAAERELFVQLAPRIRLYGLRHLRDEAAAADLVQEVMLVLLRSAREGKIENPQHVVRFVLGTCRHLVSRARRGERMARSFEAAAAPVAEAVTPPAFSRVDAARLALCMGKLDRRGQRVILLTFQEDSSADEIASELGTSAGNVRVLRHRTMAALQRCVEGARA